MPRVRIVKPAENTIEDTDTDGHLARSGRVEPAEDTEGHVTRGRGIRPANDPGDIVGDDTDGHAYKSGR